MLNNLLFWIQFKEVDGFYKSRDNFISNSNVFKKIKYACYRYQAKKLKTIDIL